MDNETLKKIVVELDGLLPGRLLGRIFQLSANSLALDFGLKHEGFLFVSVEPAAPRLYPIKRSVRELEKASVPPLHFAQALRATLGGGKLVSISKDQDERIVRFAFSSTDELGDSHVWELVAQLTGRSANLFLLNSTGKIIQALRPPKGEGLQLGELYQPPKQQGSDVSSATQVDPADRGSSPTVREGVSRGQRPPSRSGYCTDDSASISEAVDKHYRELEMERAFDSLAAGLTAKLRKEISKRKKLQANLRQDLIAHGDPEAHKRRGDLLLANLSTAKRTGNRVSLTDYYTEGSPTIAIEVDENQSLQEVAAESFSRYTKAKRAIEEISARQLELDRELVALEERRVKLNEAIASRDATALAQFEEQKARRTKPERGKKQKTSPTISGLRRYLSSDGYEVLVGRTARDNDQLTFKVARPNDLWLHAGDYPGSHVIVRNSSRVEIPQRTIIEAAQLAAKFSQASKDSKVAIHYTRRKFLTKPKGAAAGLVRLSTFKTITVEPGENLERIR